MNCCPICRAPVLTLDTARPSLEVTLDPEPLDPLGELLAAVAGRRTYTRHAAGPVHHRTARTITERPATAHPRRTVHAAHHCTRQETTR